MKSIQLLIDLAREKAHGNEAELARSLGIPLHHPHEWRTGKRNVTAETAAALCDYLGLSGEEAREWVAIAIIQNPKNAARKQMLERALFVCWVLGVGSLLSLPNDARAGSETASNLKQLPTVDLRYAHCRASNADATPTIEPSQASRWPER
jgi:plasmid maintenance system antidote protein VapI